MRFSISIFILCFSGLLHTAQDETDPYSAYRNQSNYDESLATPWVEREIKTIQLPKDADLTEFPMDGMPANMRLYGDLKHFSIGDEDKVTRLWLVARSRQGVYNGSYEGFRCATNEYKVYAYANPQRSQPLRIVPLPRWRTIKPTDYRVELIRDFLCHGTLPRPLNDVIDQLSKTSADYEPPY